MATKSFFVNKASGKKFEVINVDAEKGEITLKGEYAQFTEPFSRERFKALGYRPVVEEVPDEDEIVEDEE
jgi:ribosomal protein L15E